ncbi:MAG: hypothetical protein ACPG06_01575 [Alphaproteobacteria bacterium]
MQEVLEQGLVIRKECETLSDTLSADTSLPDTDHPIGALGMCFNHATLFVESAHNYYLQWSEAKTIPMDELDQTREQNEQRIIELGKFLYVSAMSSMEFSMKRANIRLGNPLGLPTKTLDKAYMRNMIKSSVDSNLIEQSDGALFEGAVNVRNSVVHNNGVAQRTVTYKFENDLILDLQQDQMTQGSLLTFPKLTLWVIQKYAQWCQSLLADRQ